jgi:hypothetical protein
MRARIAPALSLLALLACATPAAPPAAAAAPEPSAQPAGWKLFSVSSSTGNTFQGTAAGGQLSVTVQGRSISGPVTSLDVTAGHVRGTGSSGRSIDVGIKGNQAEGLVGMTLFSCYVNINPDGSAHITGAMGGGNTDYILSPSAINGRIGTVVYQLSWSGTQYEGPMAPGGLGFLKLPATMAAWSDVEAATVVSLLLMGA